MKKIILTENQYRLLLKEASGVPNNIINVASQIYNQFIKDLKNDEQLVTDFNNTKFKINGNFEIGDVTFKDSYINLSLIGGDDEITKYQFGVNPKDYINLLESYGFLIYKINSSCNELKNKIKS
jgi:hypothetical protein